MEKGGIAPVILKFDTNEGDKIHASTALLPGNEDAVFVVEEAGLAT